MSRADAIQATGDAVCTFRELQRLSREAVRHPHLPRLPASERETFDGKIPYTTGLRLFLPPHKDQRHMLSVISLGPPIKQGQTRYPFSSSSSRRTRTSL